jgi:hypothetical protein
MYEIDFPIGKKFGILLDFDEKLLKRRFFNT